MNLEIDLFKKYIVDFNKLIKYGFKKENDYYIYSKIFFDNSFKAIIKVNSKGNISGMVIDLDANIEYTNFRLENIGSFANTVKELYKEILIDIRNNCYKEKLYVSDYANLICDYIVNTYSDKPEFLWDKFPSFSVFRNSNNNKWYALMANINGKYFNLEGDIEILNIKIDEDKLDDLLKIDGIYKAYHMNKKNWVSILLNGIVSLNLIKELVDRSYTLINEKNTWIIPANQKYYDVKNI